MDRTAGIVPAALNAEVDASGTYHVRCWAAFGTTPSRSCAGPG